MRILLVTSVLIALASPLTAENPINNDTTASEVSHPRQQSLLERIELALDSVIKAPFDVADEPLIEIIAILQADYDIPILFDHSALSELAISPETEVTLHVRNITFRKTLELLFRQSGLEDLTFVVDDEVLLAGVAEHPPEDDGRARRRPVLPHVRAQRAPFRPIAKTRNAVRTRMLTSSHSDRPVRYATSSATRWS
jgi:hypothetical protein